MRERERERERESQEPISHKNYLMEVDGCDAGPAFGGCLLSRSS